MCVLLNMITSPGNGFLEEEAELPVDMKGQAECTLTLYSWTACLVSSESLYGGAALTCTGCMSAVISRN